MKRSISLTSRRRRLRPVSRRPAPRPAPVKITNILVPIDFSAASLTAIDSAVLVRDAFQAQLHFVHVYAPESPLSALSSSPMTVADPEVAQRVRRHLRDVAGEYGVGSTAEVHARKGRAFEEICRMARASDIDLLVLSTHGHTGLKHLALGSTAERVIRYAHCPVLVVRGPDRLTKSNGNGNGKPPRAALRFRKIIVPIDFSESSLQALEYAKGLAKTFKSKLVLLHSVHFQYYVASDEYARYDFPVLMQEAENVAREQMRELVRKTEWDGIKVESMIEIGHPGQQICALAQGAGADLVVTSTHGWTGLKHVLVGSTAEYIVRHAQSPVLVVPTRERPIFD